MPILRNEIYEFVRIWNVHRIRRQPKRPNAVVGQPLMLYKRPMPGDRKCGFVPDQQLLSEIQNDVSEWGKKIILIISNHILINNRY
jgi:hypothetical protein